MSTAKILKTYRGLWRAANLAFEGDQYAINQAHNRIRTEYRTKIDPSELSKKLQLAKDVSRLLRSNVVQGTKEEEAKFRLRFNKESELGDNDSRFGSNLSEFPSGGGCCSSKR